MKKTLLMAGLAALLWLPGGGVPAARAQGTAITYQGQLVNAGVPANGYYDVAFGLWSAATGSVQVGATLTNTLLVTNGIYLATIDFGTQAFTGAPRWLEIAVRTNGGGSFYTLTPRVLVTPAPSALFAANAGSVAATNLVGSILLTQLPSVVLTNGAGGVALSGAFGGDGSGLTNLSAAVLTGAGSLPLAVLPAAVVTNGATGVTLTGAFSGNGCNLTNLNGTALVPGTVAAGSLAPGAISAIAGAITAAGGGGGGGGGLAAGSVIMSAAAVNTNLANAGYVKIYGSFTTPESWQGYTNIPVGQPPAARNGHTALWTGSEMLVWGGHGDGAYLNDGGRYNPALDSWGSVPVVPGSTPAGRLGHTAVWTGNAMIIWGGLGGTNYYNDGGYYDPVQNSWTYISTTGATPPVGRLQHSAIWTGSQLLVWGGKGATGTRNDGGLYNPGLKTWTAIDGGLANAPAAREYHAAVWTGTNMIVWGGDATGTGVVLGDGGIYNPAANSWTTISSALANSPEAREYHTVVWTGTQMIIWGGVGAGSDLSDGGIFNPALNSWTYINGSLPNTPAERDSHTAVWTGTQMIVWGGYSDTTGSLMNDGGIYNPTANTWAYIDPGLGNTPGPRFQDTAVWTGTEMIVWGGAGMAGSLNDGGRYNPTANTWIYLAGQLVTTPPGRTGATAVWTGSEMIIWGGTGAGSYLNDGGRFNPALNSWIYLAGAAANTPAARNQHTAVWTGTQMVVWGGLNANGFLGDGGQYNPVCACWTAIAAAQANEPSARSLHSAVWTGTQMLVWGGLSLNNACNDGGLYDPGSQTWTAVAASLANTPPARSGQSAVWTGTEFLVWGGIYNGTLLADGGRYNPTLNTWIYLPNTLTGTPGARTGATAVWTGAELIVWGGTGAGGALNDGGRYNPASGAWTYLGATGLGTPSVRSGHTAVWSGSEMIVWGGSNGSTALGDGGRFDPAGGNWTYIAPGTSGEPGARTQHTAVWAANQMLVWGGLNGNTYLSDLSGYTPGRTLYLYQHP